MDKCLLKKLIAECIGTFVLVFVACGVAVWTEGDKIATSLAFGLVIVAMAYSIGNISGCHINPAVSLAMAIRKKITWKEFALYVAAQFVGAIIGALLLGIILKNATDNADLKLFANLGGNEIQESLKKVNKFGEVKLNAMSYISAFLVEVILTFIFVIAILGVTDKKFHDGKHAGLVIGLTLTLVHLFGMGFTGTSVNPARSFAPALFQFFGKNKDSFKQVWIWLAPMAGSALAAFVYSFFAGKSECDCKCECKAEAKEVEAKEEVKAEEVKAEETKAETNTEAKTE